MWSLISMMVGALSFGYLTIRSHAVVGAAVAKDDRTHTSARIHGAVATS